MIRVPDMPDVRRLAIIDGQVQPSLIGGYVFYIDLQNRMSVAKGIVEEGNKQIKELERVNRRLQDQYDEQLAAARVLNETIVSSEKRHQDRIKELEAQVSRLQDSLQLRIARDLIPQHEPFGIQYQPSIAIDGGGNYS